MLSRWRLDAVGSIRSEDDCGVAHRLSPAGDDAA